MVNLIVSFVMFGLTVLPTSAVVFMVPEHPSDEPLTTVESNFNADDASTIAETLTCGTFEPASEWERQFPRPAFNTGRPSDVLGGNEDGGQLKDNKSPPTPPPAADSDDVVTISADRSSVHRDFASFPEQVMPHLYLSLPKQLMKGTKQALAPPMDTRNLSRDAGGQGLVMCIPWLRLKCRSRRIALKKTCETQRSGGAGRAADPLPRQHRRKVPDTQDRKLPMCDTSSSSAHSDDDDYRTSGEENDSLKELSKRRRFSTQSSGNASGSRWY